MHRQKLQCRHPPSHHHHTKFILTTQRDMCAYCVASIRTPIWLLHGTKYQQGKFGESIQFSLSSTFISSTQTVQYRVIVDRIRIVRASKQLQPICIICRFVDFYNLSQQKKTNYQLDFLWYRLQQINKRRNLSTVFAIFLRW